ncbi:MAG: hypothetical protein OEZ25_00290 [Candidatus Bathyarchaeota archaeon]|nr:hypothetical protein [Candidatus Bathyarchaeota archaeon]
MSKMFWVWSYNFIHAERELDDWLTKILVPRLKGIKEIGLVVTYRRVFGLGQRPIYQTWIEIPDFAFFNKWSKLIKEKEWQDTFHTFFTLAKDFNTSIMRSI